MDFTPKQYLLIYGLVVTSIVISLLFVRRNQNPSRLNLKGTSGRSPTTPAGESAARAVDGASTAVASVHRPINAEKSLNILFNWNGHSWDAYEVLGVPAGSSLSIVKDAHAKLLTQSGSDAHAFFNAAYDTIVKNSSRS